jgi:uncharacterized protein YlaI
MDLYVCPECGKTVPQDQMVNRPMVLPAPIRSSPQDGVGTIEKLGPQVCPECHDKMDTMKDRIDRLREVNVTHRSRS